MTSKKIVYPKSLKDIPLWRRRQLKEDLLWFLKFSPVERLECIDREWEEIQNFIKKFGLKKHGNGKKVSLRGSSIDDLIRLKKIRKTNVKDHQDIEYLLEAKLLSRKSKINKES